MEKKDQLDSFFEEFINSKPLFKEKSVLQAAYTPQNIPHREDYIQLIAQVLAPALRCERPSNLFIYGKTGTGKTLCVKHVINKIGQLAQAREIPVRVIMINCKLKKVADTEYRILLEILHQLGKELPFTGLSTNELYKELYTTVDQEKQIFILVLDEIDSLIQKVGDEVLYNITRINSELENAEIGLIGITNDLVIMDNIDARVKSSLGEEELVFSPYNAVQIQDILDERSDLAFKEGILNEEVLPRIAAYAAREHGDVRRALELLRFSGEVAEREGSERIMSAHVERANKRMEKSRIVDIVKSQPKQFQLVTLSIIKTSMTEKVNLVTNRKNKVIEPTTTGAVYDYYTKVCNSLGMPVLGLRRVSDIVSELEVLGLINFKVVSKGRYGRTRFITIGLPKSMYPEVIGIIKQDLGLE